MKYNNKISVMIKTCFGRPSLLWVLDSIKFSLKEVEYRIYISDEMPLDKWKIELYDKLKEEGHHIEVHNNGISCGLARNQLINKLNDEDLVLRLDDDFELGGEFNIRAMQAVLNMSSDIGFCSDYERQLGDNKGVKSGSLRPAGGDFIISPPKLIKRFHSPWKKHQKQDNVRYSLAEHTRNLILVKREVLNTVKWSEDIYFYGEHEEFMLSIKEKGYIGAYTPDSIHYHRDDLALYRDVDDGENRAFRRPGELEFRKLLQTRFNCNSIKTKYPSSWYFLEFNRRIISRVLS
jgi:hypothetical protein